MNCPKCGYEPLFNWAMVVYSAESPCIACGFDMDGVEFYSEASSEYVVEVEKNEVER